MKSIRFLKLRTCANKPEDLALMRNINPLSRMLSMKPHRQTTSNFLNAYKVPVDMSIASKEPWVHPMRGDGLTQSIPKFVLWQRPSRLARMGQKYQALHASSFDEVYILPVGFHKSRSNFCRNRDYNSTEILGKSVCALRWRKPRDGYHSR